MVNKDYRIVFMGTPDFAVPSLDLLYQNGFNIVGVVTAPDKPAGRGRQLQTSAIKDFALSKGLNILQPEKLKDQGFLDKLKELKADLFVVVAFRMLPELVWTMPPDGTINLHGSLLPMYRGAAPINRAVMNGETRTGVTTFFLKHEIDTGNIIMRKEISIGPDETAGELHDRMMMEGAIVLLETVRSISACNYSLITQEDAAAGLTELKHAPKIFKEDCRINWNKKASEIKNLIRGLSPYPSAFTTFSQENDRFSVKISRASVSGQNIEPGIIITDNKSYIQVGTGEGSISILELQPEGRKKMSVREFLNGTKIKENAFFS